MHHRNLSVLTARLLLVTLLFFLTTGCSSAGLSTHEFGLQTYSMYLQEVPLSSTTTPSNTLTLPKKITLVQVGEIAPPQHMLDTLRSRHELFTAVSAQTGQVDGMYEAEPYQADNDRRLIRNDRLARLRSLAGQTNSSYLLLFGGEINTDNEVTPLTIFNLTIIGAFVVPSETVVVRGKAAGSLIDVKSGQLLMTFSSETSGSGLACSMYASDALKLGTEKARGELADKLAADIIKQLSDQQPSR